MNLPGHRTCKFDTAKNDLLFLQLHLLPELQLWHGFKGWSNGSPLWAVSVHWTGLLDCTTGLDYWTHPKCLFQPFSV